MVDRDSEDLAKRQVTESWTEWSAPATLAERLQFERAVEVARTGGPESFARVALVPPVFFLYRSYHKLRMATTTLMSFAEFERLEESAGKTELLQGELIRVPPAQKRHKHITKRLLARLQAALAPLQQSGSFPAGEVEIEMGYRLRGEPASWLQPDVSITHADQPGDPYYHGAPLIVFEVVSPSDSATRLNSKVAAYLANGAAEVWLIYPDRPEAWVYETSDAARKETQSIHTPPFPDIEIPFSEIL